jgi:CxxC-x17-CxxC domain-containing protein
VSFSDRTLNCVDCGAEFVFTASDQEFHASRGFTNEPKRCPDCRRARKATRGDGGGGYGGGGGGGYGGGGGGYSSEPRQMYPATCANCGRETEVPFQPRGTRPVYCRDCFRTMAPQQGGGGGGGRRY